MKIIILGCNQVGISLAENLSSEANDITIVDPDANALRELKDLLDIGIKPGWPSHPDVLRAAGADDADMIVAVTENDEVNMIACQVAYSVFRTPKKICRLRSNSYLAQENLFNNDAIPLDVVISPELLVSNDIKRLIELPGSLQVLDFADGKAQLVGVRAYPGSPLVGHEISQLRRHMPNVDARVAAIFRQNHAIKPEGSTVIEADDEVFFIAAARNIRAVMSELRRVDKPYKRVIIAGGGNIGMRLAEALEQKYQIKVIELDPARCAVLSEYLQRSIVLNGMASDKQLLLEESIEHTDVFLALTNDDEANIMSSLLAKRLGAHKVMCLINNADYVDLVQGRDIDIAISPQQTSIGRLLTHIRRGDIVSVHSLRRGAAEALEIVVHGDRQSSKVVGRALSQLDLPKGTTIGAIVRDHEVWIAHDHIVLESGDHVILFLMDRKRIPELERLFAVGFTFF